MKTPNPTILEALYHALDYDPATGEIRWRESRRRVTEGDLAGSIDQRDGSLVIGFNGTSYRAHHLAWYLHTGRWPNTLITFRDRNPMNLAFTNLHAKAYAFGSKADYMRQWRAAKKRAKALQMDKRLHTSALPNVTYGAGDVWSVRSLDNHQHVLASFKDKAAAEDYAGALAQGRRFAAANRPELFDDDRDDRTAGGPGTLTYAKAVTKFAYDPETGAIYRRAIPGREVDFTGLPAIEIDDTRRPIVRASGRTYSAGMLAWFLHTGGDWPKRKQIGYRDGNRKNTAWPNLYLKGTDE